MKENLSKRMQSGGVAMVCEVARFVHIFVNGIGMQNRALDVKIILEEWSNRKEDTAARKDNKQEHTHR